MNLASFVSFMTFHFFLNLTFHANICPIRNLILIYFIFLEKIRKSMPAQMEHFQTKASQPTFFQF